MRKTTGCLITKAIGCSAACRTHGAKPGQVHHASESHGVTLLKIVLSYDDLDQLTGDSQKDTREDADPADPGVDDLMRSI